MCIFVKVCRNAWNVLLSIQRAFAHTTEMVDQCYVYHVFPTVQMQTNEMKFQMLQLLLSSSRMLVRKSPIRCAMCSNDAILILFLFFSCRERRDNWITKNRATSNTDTSKDNKNQQFSTGKKQYHLAWQHGISCKINIRHETAQIGNRPSSCWIVLHIHKYTPSKWLFPQTNWHLWKDFLRFKKCEMNKREAHDCEQNYMLGSKDKEEATVTVIAFVARNRQKKEKKTTTTISKK